MDNQADIRLKSGALRCLRLREEEEREGEEAGGGGRWTTNGKLILVLTTALRAIGNEVF